MAITYTPRFGLINWGQGSDAVTRSQWNDAFAVVEANAAIDEFGTRAARPAPAKRGRYYHATDVNLLYRDTGTSWVVLGGPQSGTTATRTNAQTSTGLPVGALFWDTSQSILYAWSGSGWLPAMPASSWASVTGKPTIFPTNWSNVADKPSTMPSTWATVSGKPTIFPTNWDNVAGKPSTFAPSTHSHSWDSITSKPTLFDTTWGRIQNPPSIFPTNWANVANKPSTYATTWDLVAGKPARYPSDWNTLANIPTVFPTTWDNVAEKPARYASEWAQFTGTPTATQARAVVNAVPIIKGNNPGTALSGWIANDSACYVYSFGPVRVMTLEFRRPGTDVPVGSTGQFTPGSIQIFTVGSTYRPDHTVEAAFTYRDGSSAYGGVARMGGEGDVRLISGVPGTRIGGRDEGFSVRMTFTYITS